MKWTKAINGEELTWRDSLQIMQYFDGVFRAQIFIMSLSVALLAYARAYQRYAILVLCAFLVSITMMFSIYTMIQLTRVLRKSKHYSPFNGVYYFLGTVTLFLIGLFVLLGVDWEKLLKERKITFNWSDNKPVADLKK